MPRAQSWGGAKNPSPARPTWCPEVALPLGCASFTIGAVRKDLSLPLQGLAIFPCLSPSKNKSVPIWE